jgi:hypothetical protein
MLAMFCKEHTEVLHQDAACHLSSIILLPIRLQDPVFDAAQQVNMPVTPQAIVKLAISDFVFRALPPVAFRGGLS